MTDLPRLKMEDFVQCDPGSNGPWVEYEGDNGKLEGINIRAMDQALTAYGQQLHSLENAVNHVVRQIAAIRLELDERFGSDSEFNKEND